MLRRARVVEAALIRKVAAVEGLRPKGRSAYSVGGVLDGDFAEWGVLGAGTVPGEGGEGTVILVRLGKIIRRRFKTETPLTQYPFYSSDPDSSHSTIDRLRTQRTSAVGFEFRSWSAESVGPTANSFAVGCPKDQRVSDAPTG